jgi:hypothetical protein
MAFNGSGTFNRLYSWAADAANSINISATRMDSEDSGFASGLSNCVTRDGQSPFLANIPAGGFKLTGLANGSTSGDSVAYGQLASYLPLAGGTVTGPLVATHQNSTTTGAVVIRDAAGNPGGGYLQFTNNDRSAEYFYIRGVSGSGNVSGPICSVSDNFHSCGLASFRWSVVYAGTGTINTSDERDKLWRGALNDAELAAGKAISGELGIYQWLASVAEKGDAARLHVGVRAQQVWAIMAKHGLVDPIGTDGKPGKTPYAFLCFDEWEAIPEIPASAGKQDDDGNWIETPTPGVPARDAGWRYGLRVDQLALFLIACQEARLTALES